jgi:hypothetical protein
VAAVFWSPQGEHHAGVKVDYRLASVISAQRRGIAPSSLG